MFRQRLLNSSWNRHAQKMLRTDDLRVICNVQSSMFINDLGREFEYKVPEVVSRADYNKSKELRLAIDKRYFTVLDKHSVTPPQRNNNQQEIQKKAQKLAQEMTDMNQSMIEKLAKEMAKEMAKEIIAQMPKQNSIMVNNNNMGVESHVVNKPTQAVDVEQDTFVPMEAIKEDVESNIDLSSQSENKTLSSDTLKSSIAKMKSLKKKKRKE